MDPSDGEERPKPPAGEDRAATGDDSPPGTKAKASAFVGRLLKIRIPLSLVLVGLVLIGAFLLASLLSRDPVDLGPSIDGAVDAQLSLTVCNEVVDQRGFNPRTAELDAESGLRDLGVKQAKVVLARIDCGPDAPAAEPG